MQLPRLGRYTIGARVYDVASGERPVYRVGRVDAISRLRLGPGDRVLDLGCGTGLNFPLLWDTLGPTGQITGVDVNASMLARARSRVEAAHDGDGGAPTRLLSGDAGHLDDLLRSAPGEDEPTYDAVLATYSLSIIPDWRDTWSQALSHLRPGGRAAIVDLGLPSGWGFPLWPLARLACYTGGADPHREPWRSVQELRDVTTRRHRFGHVVLAVGTKM